MVAFCCFWRYYLGWRFRFFLLFSFFSSEKFWLKKKKILLEKYSKPLFYKWINWCQGWLLKVPLGLVAELELEFGVSGSPFLPPWLVLCSFCYLPLCLFSFTFPCGSFFFWDVLHGLTFRHTLFNLLILFRLAFPVKKFSLQMWLSLECLIETF